MSRRAVRGLTLAGIAGLALFSLVRLEMTGSIAHFIPSKAEAELVQISLELIDSPLARRMILSISGGPERFEVAEQLADSLRAHEEVAWVESKLDEQALRDIYALYFERRVYLASTRPEVEIPALLSRPSLELTADRMRRRLAGPEAALVSRVASSDPLGLFESVVARVQAFRGSDEPASPTDDAEGYVLVQLGLRSSPFDAERQVALLDFIEREFARLAPNGGEGWLLEQSGVNRMAVASERSVRGDVSFISLVSMIAVSGLFLYVFRSPRQLMLAIITPLAGFVFALAVTLAMHDTVHGITLAFGFILIGVAIDYPIHLINHQSFALSPGRSTAAPEGWRSGVRGSLLLSGATTTLAFLSVSSSDFPGLAGMGSFAAMGVVVALLLTLFALPSFLPDGPEATASQRAFAGRLIAGVSWLGVHRRVVHLGLAACLGIAAAGLPRLHWQDDPSELMQMDPVLLAEAKRVQARAAEFDGGRFVVGLAQDRESALVLNERIHERLEGLVGSDALDGMGSLQSFLISESLQHRNLAAFRAQPDLASRIDDVFSDRGFARGAFAPFAAAVEAPAVAPLLPADLEQSPFRRVLALLVPLDGRYAVITLLRGARSGSAIRGALDGLDSVHYVNQQDIMAGIYEGYRRSTVRLVGFGALVVSFVLLVRYRRPSRAALAFLPAALGVATTLGVFGLLDVPVNVVSAISLLVVLGMGVDYGIFAVDAAADPARQAATLSSLVVSCLTSVSVFGVLALAGQPVLQAIGLTTGLGVVIALAVAAPVMALARRA